MSGLLFVGDFVQKAETRSRSALQSLIDIVHNLENVGDLKPMKLM